MTKALQFTLTRDFFLWRFAILRPKFAAAVSLAGRARCFPNRADPYSPSLPI